MYQLQAPFKDSVILGEIQVRDLEGKNFRKDDGDIRHHVTI